MKDEVQLVAGPDHQHFREVLQAFVQDFSLRQAAGENKIREIERRLGDTTGELHLLRRLLEDYETKINDDNVLILRLQHEIEALQGRVKTLDQKSSQTVSLSSRLEVRLENLKECLVQTCSDTQQSVSKLLGTFAKTHLSGDYVRHEDPRHSRAAEEDERAVCVSKDASVCAENGYPSERDIPVDAEFDAVGGTNTISELDHTTRESAKSTASRQFSLNSPPSNALQQSSAQAHEQATPTNDDATKNEGTSIDFHSANDTDTPPSTGDYHSSSGAKSSIIDTSTCHPNATLQHPDDTAAKTGKNYNADNTSQDGSDLTANTAPDNSQALPNLSLSDKNPPEEEAHTSAAPTNPPPPKSDNIPPNASKGSKGQGQGNPKGNRGKKASRGNKGQGSNRTNRNYRTTSLSEDHGNHYRKPRTYSCGEEHSNRPQRTASASEEEHAGYNTRRRTTSYSGGEQGRLTNRQHRSSVNEEQRKSECTVEHSAARGSEQHVTSKNTEQKMTQGNEEHVTSKNTKQTKRQGNEEHVISKNTEQTKRQDNEEHVTSKNSEQRKRQCNEEHVTSKNTEQKRQGTEEHVTSKITEQKRQGTEEHVISKNTEQRNRQGKEEHVISENIEQRKTEGTEEHVTSKKPEQTKKQDNEECINSKNTEQTNKHSSEEHLNSKSNEQKQSQGSEENVTSKNNEQTKTEDNDEHLTSQIDEQERQDNEEQTKGSDNVIKSYAQAIKSQTTTKNKKQANKRNKEEQNSSRGTEQQTTSQGTVNKAPMKNREEQPCHNSTEQKDSQDKKMVRSESERHPTSSQVGEEHKASPCEQKHITSQNREKKSPALLSEEQTTSQSSEEQNITKNEEQLPSPCKEEILPQRALVDACVSIKQTATGSSEERNPNKHEQTPSEDNHTHRPSQDSEGQTPSQNSQAQTKPNNNEDDQSPQHADEQTTEDRGQRTTAESNNEPANHLDSEQNTAKNTANKQDPSDQARTRERRVTFQRGSGDAAEDANTHQQSLSNDDNDEAATNSPQRSKTRDDTEETVTAHTPRNTGAKQKKFKNKQKQAKKEETYTMERLETVSGKEDSSAAADLPALRRRSFRMEGVEDQQEPEVGMCANCGFLAKLRCANCRQAFYCKRECQRDHWKNGHKDQCQPFQVLESPELGRYMVASRDLKAGDVILKEEPIVVGPKQITEPLCLGCYTRVDGSYRCQKCNWPMCGPACESSPDHLPECVVGQEIGSPIDIANFDEPNHFYEVVFPLRCLALKKKSPKKYEQLLSLESHYEDRKGTHLHQENQKSIVNFLRNYFFIMEFPIEDIDSSEKSIHTVTGIIDVNALELRLKQSEVLGLYPTFAMMEHSCTPNSKHSFNKDRQVIVKAAVDIKRGEHISTMYTHVLWGTLARRDHLKHSKYFMCTCFRCSDPTELGTHFSALRCKHCTNGFMLSAAPLDELASWICTTCNATISHEEVTAINLKLGEEVEEALAMPSLDRLERIVQRHGKNTVHPNHFHLFATRHTLLQMYGRDPSSTGEESMKKKEKMCQDFLKVCTALDPGMSRLAPYAGVALYEYHLAVLARARQEPDAKQVDSVALKKDVETAKALLQQCIRVLQDEPPDQPEGQLCHVAQQNLAELRQWEATLSSP